MNAKPLTHALAAGLVMVTGILCSPFAHDALLKFAGHNPYLAIIVPAVLGLAALYHNPKQGG